MIRTFFIAAAIALLGGSLSAQITQSCFPGTNGVIACPCAQPTNPNGGCANFGAGSTTGAILNASGTPSVSADTVVLTVSNERILTNGLLNVFYTVKPGSLGPGTQHGAGVRCTVGGVTKRLYTVPVYGGTGSMPGVGDPSVSVRTATGTLASPIIPPETRYYFNLYRDPQAPGPCGMTQATVNLSNTVSILWSL